MATATAAPGAGASYPLTLAQLKEFINGIARQGQSFRSQFPLLQASGYKSIAQVQSQLQSGGYTPMQAGKIVNSQGSALNRLLRGIDVLPVPIAAGAAGGAEAAGAGTAAAAGGAEAGGAAGGAAGGSALAGTAGKALAGLTTAGALSDIWSSAQSSAKYAGLLVAALVLGAVMIFRAFSGSGQHTRIVPVPA